MTLEELGKELKKFTKFKYITVDQFSIKLYNSQPTYNSSCRFWEGKSVSYIDKNSLSVKLDLSKFKKGETPTGRIIPDYSKALEKL